MYFDPGGEGGLIDGSNAVREARSMFGVTLAADLHEDVAQKVESPPLLRSESLPVVSPETRSCGLASARNLSPVFSSCWLKGWFGTLGRLPL